MVTENFKNECTRGLSIEAGTGNVFDVLHRQNPADYFQPGKHIVPLRLWRSNHKGKVMTAGTHQVVRMSPKHMEAEFECCDLILLRRRG
jgi:hypothetical protein